MGQTIPSEPHRRTPARATLFLATVAMWLTGILVGILALTRLPLTETGLNRGGAALLLFNAAGAALIVGMLLRSRRNHGV